MGEKQSTFKANIAREQAAAYLEDLAASLRAGTVALSQGNRQVVLSPARSMALELEVSDKKGRQKLDLELSWYVVPEIESEDSLTISAQTPETVPADEEDGEQGDDDSDGASEDALDPEADDGAEAS